MTLGFYLYSLLTKTPRVRVVVKNEHDETLLVKPWTSSDAWSFPGGGVERGESYESAACRELREETGIIASDDQLKQIGKIHIWGHEETVFLLRVPSKSLSDVLPRPFEIQEAAWFSKTSTPKLESLAGQIYAKMDTNQ